MQYNSRMHMKRELNTIVEVIAGYTFRTALKNKEKSSLFVLQAKNISDNSCVDEDALEEIDFEPFWSKAIVKKGDIVISAKGSFRAGVIAVGSKNIIATSSVYILRPKNDTILPEYLAIFLNTSLGQKQIIQKATGAMISTILRKDLEHIYINIPDIETQKKIIRLYFIHKKLQKVLEKKRDVLCSMNEGIIHKLLNN